jgi:hypothetical protein
MLARRLHAAGWAALKPALPSLSRAVPVPVREVWAREAQHFTQALKLNADVLSDLLGLDPEISAAEQRVGRFALDLTGRDLQTGETVIIENQFGVHRSRPPRAGGDLRRRHGPDDDRAVCA